MLEYIYCPHPCVSQNKLTSFTADAGACSFGSQASRVTRWLRALSDALSRSPRLCSFAIFILLSYSALLALLTRTGPNFSPWPTGSKESLGGSFHVRSTVDFTLCALKCFHLLLHGNNRRTVIAVPCRAFPIYQSAFSMRRNLCVISVLAKH